MFLYIPINNINNTNNINNKNFITESAKLTALARVDIVKALQNMRTKYKTKKEADSIFLDLYNSGMYLPKIHKFIGSISIGTLHRWILAYENNEDYKALLPNYKYTKQGEYNTILTQEMKNIFIKFLLHPNKFSVTKAIKLTQHILENKPAWMKRGEKLHKDIHKKLTNNYIPTVQELIKYIDCYLDFHNSKPCPNNRSKTIQEMLNDISKENIDKNILNDLMMKIRKTS